ncbi:MAG: iron export ABC transporter permease subunit FetB [Gammaproteobacteria bacterium]|nr:iron export ABC transporter permease subunit FetB [Gammaproteobacteria bacterium]
MNIIILSNLDLLYISIFIVLLSFVLYRMNVGYSSEILIAAVRNFIQLIFLAYILQFIFNNEEPWQILLISIVMLLIAGWEIHLRQEYRIRRRQSLWIATTSLFITTFFLTWFSLQIVIMPEPWYTPQYAVPLLGILLGNTMTGISLGMNTMTQNIYHHRHVIEQRLMLGESAQEAIKPIRNSSIRTALIPIVNSMAVAGLVSIPGMMTGQILSGTEPMTAVYYQIMIYYLISASSGFSIILSTWQISKSVFDERDRLIISRLTKK